MNYEVNFRPISTRITWEITYIAGLDGYEIVAVAPVDGITVGAFAFVPMREISLEDANIFHFAWLVQNHLLGMVWG